MAGAGSTVVRFPGRSAAQRRARRLAVGAGALALALALGWLLFLSPVFAIERIAVSGTALVDRAEVERRLEPLQGTPLTRVGQGRVEDLLVGVAGLASVESTAKPPSELEVRVGEHAPVARRAADAGVDVLLEDGSVLAGVPADRVDRALGGRTLPEADPALLSGPPGSRASAALVLSGLPEDLRAQVRSVQAPSAEVVRLTLVEGPVVVWGDARERERKAAVVEAFLTDTGPRGPLAGVTELDVSVPERPLTR